MKTSQAIRQAVDNWLDHPDINEDKDRVDWLCWCIVQEFICVPGVKLRTEIARLPLNLREVCWIFECETDFTYVKASRRKLQEMRFMYAEFLALYFEDLGD